MTFNACWGAQDVDPDVEILTRRAEGLRRFLTKFKEAGKIIEVLYNLYKVRGEPAMELMSEDGNQRVIAGDPLSRMGAAMRT